MSDPIIWIWTPVYTYQFNWKDAANFCGCTTKIFVSHLLRSLFLVKSQARVLLDLSVISHFVFQNQEQLLRNTSYKWIHDVIAMSWDVYTTTRRRMYSCNDAVCPLVIVKARMFDFADILILRNIKIFQSFVFLICNTSTFDVYFFRKWAWN